MPDSQGPTQGERLVKIETIVEGIQGSLNQLKSGLSSRVEKDGKDIERLKADTDNNLSYLNAVNRKVDDRFTTVDDKIEDHKNNHWKWITVMVGLLAIAGLITKL